MEDKKPLYKRVLIKLSGEALSAGAEGILNYAFLEKVCTVIKTCVDMGTQVSIVVGAGNIWRGRQGTGMDRTRADHMGMLATVINCLALQDTFEKLGTETRVMTAIEMCGAVYPQQSDFSSEKGACRDFRMRHRESVFFDGYRGGAESGRDRSRYRPPRQKCRRCLHGGSEAGSGSKENRQHRIYRHPSRGTAGFGFYGDLVQHGKSYSDSAFRTG